MRKQKHTASQQILGGKRPITKEEALRQLVEQDPQKVARLLQEILKEK